MIIFSISEIFKKALDKFENCVILAVYKQITKSTRLSGRSIFKINMNVLTTIYRSISSMLECLSTQYIIASLRNNFFLSRSL